MKVEITQTGVYDGKGNRIAVGTQIDVPGDAMPAWLVNKARAMGGGGKIAVTNPAAGAKPGYEAVHRGGGRYSVMKAGAEVMAGLSKGDASAFNDMSDADKAEYLAMEAA